MPNGKKTPIGKAISDEVRKDQGETPTFPHSEREFEEKSRGEIGDDPAAAVRKAREKAEIERVPGGDDIDEYGDKREALEDEEEIADNEDEGRV